MISCGGKMKDSRCFLPWNYVTKEGKEFCRFLRKKNGLKELKSYHDLDGEDVPLLFQVHQIEQVAQKTELFHRSKGWCRFEPSGVTIDETFDTYRPIKKQKF